jgi:hypothetical protein
MPASVTSLVRENSNCRRSSFWGLGQYVLNSVESGCRVRYVFIYRPKSSADSTRAAEIRITAMLEFLETIAAILVIIVVPAILIILVRDRLRAKASQLSDAEREQRRAAWHERMMHPEIDKVEEFCRGKLPQRVIDMYLNRHDLLFNHGFEISAPGDSWWIEDFVPLTVQDQNLTTDLAEFGKGTCFAGDGMGNFYWVPVDDERKEDGPVYFACHDPWGDEKVAESLNEFLSWPRASTGKR